MSRDGWQLGLDMLSANPYVAGLEYNPMKYGTGWSKILAVSMFLKWVRILLSFMMPSSAAK